MNQYDFASRIAAHQRQAISSALMELGCIEPPAEIHSPVALAPVPVGFVPMETRERRIYQVS